MTELLDEAAEALERRLFFEQFRARYRELRRDSDSWAEIEAERAGESSALADRAR